jgi:ASC-1-like (ASCH) protein
MKHRLKTWPEYFEALLSGKKTFEIRKNDRDYQVNDLLLLQKYNHENK